MNQRLYSDLLLPGKSVYLIGIGGVSMSALASVLNEMGLHVSGSEIQESPVLQRLRTQGIPVVIGHNPNNLPSCDCVIRTAAARDDNVEVMETRSRKIPLLERSEAWGLLMRQYAQSICIAGTHGKTTTTSMLTWVTVNAGLDPTVMIGGTLPLLGSGHRIGHSGLMIMEACEYSNSFLNFSPTMAIILNIEADHLDFFADLQAIRDSFRKFSLLTPKTGAVILNADNSEALALADNLPRQIVTFGQNPSAYMRVHNLQNQNGFYAFDAYADNSFYAAVSLKVPGLHNVQNAMAVIACCHQMGLSGDLVSRYLSTFTGVGRRFEWKGSFQGARVADDYAHHPSEITATLQTALTLGFGRVICVFQPHTYSRMEAFFADFVKALSPANIVVIAEIYAARETNTHNISSRSLADALAKRHPHVYYFASQPEIIRFLKECAQANDLILTMGAGDIYKVGEEIVSA